MLSATMEGDPSPHDARSSCLANKQAAHLCPAVLCGLRAGGLGRGEGPATALEGDLSTAVTSLQGAGRLGPGTLWAQVTLHQSVPRTGGRAATFLWLPPSGEKGLPHPSTVMLPSAQNFVRKSQNKTHLA